MLIKKYPNRKLYNVEEHKYITLSDLVSFVKLNKDFIIIDNVSKVDITKETLQSAVFAVKEFDLHSLKEMCK